MKTQINCHNCKNPFGTLDKKVLTINSTRVSNTEHDFNTKKTSVKCRKCSHYSTVFIGDDLVNEIDYKKTSKNLLQNL